MYVPTNWKNGDVITADKLNNIETGIQNTENKIDDSAKNVEKKIDNSAVGTNLLLNTGKNLIIKGENSSAQTSYHHLLANGYNVSSLALALGTQFTLSFDWSVSGSSPSGTFYAQWNDAPWDINVPKIQVSSSNTSGHSSGTFSISADSKNVANTFGFKLENLVGILTISNLKLEKGNLSTDWSPNPSEILTQSDYSKIKAAIVALGGSLS